MLAVLVCTFGCAVTARLAHRTVHARGFDGLHWLLLASVCAGSSTWATHFIAMLGYNPGVKVNFDVTLTIVSALIAIAGTGIGLTFARLPSGRLTALCGGGLVGLAMAAMHYSGMFAFRPDGIVAWNPYYVTMSIAVAIILCAVAVDRLKLMNEKARGPAWDATLMLVGAILSLHFLGMAALTVTPIAGYSPSADSEVFTSLAAAIALAAVLIVGTGISTHLVEEGRAQAEEALQKIAMYDTLTGIANRHSFVTQLANQCKMLAAEEPQPFALLMIDLDRFKAVNDTMGHPVGDLLLKNVAKRLQSVARSGDLVGRLGGDEFAMVARGVADHGQARAIAEKIVDVLSSPFELDGYIAEIGASVGVTLAPTESDDAETLSQQADAALYRAKRDGRGRVCIFDPAMTRDMLDRCALEKELRHALSNDTFEIRYQPIFDTHSRRCTGAEALLRWHSPTRGNVSPEILIPIAEELGLISALGEAILKRACAIATRWPDDTTLSVNVSPLQITSGQFLSVVEAALLQTGLPPQRLEIEIVESSLLSDNDVVHRTLEGLRALGVQIALDDFGKGYSSLSYLKRFPIDRIKIDRSFISHLLEDSGNASIVRAICQLGASLSLSVTAEGVENTAQVEFVAAYGCTNIQGFFLSEPLDEDAATAIVLQKSQALRAKTRRPDGPSEPDMLKEVG